MIEKVGTIEISPLRMEIRNWTIDLSDNKGIDLTKYAKLRLDGASAGVAVKGAEFVIPQTRAET